MTEASKNSSRASAWQGDWQVRLKARLAARGFSTTEEFISTQPVKSLVTLADELGPDDVAAVQLEWSYLDDAKLRGTIEHCARDLLVRQLHEKLPGGWTTTRIDMAAVWPRVNAMSAWASSISSRLPEYNEVVSAFSRRVQDENAFPVGWLPANADDPVLMDAFRRYWQNP